MLTELVVESVVIESEQRVGAFANIHFAPVAVDAIKPALQAHVPDLSSPIDLSFLEDHIPPVEPLPYRRDGQVAGWTAIQVNESLITQFGLTLRTVIISASAHLCPGAQAEQVRGLRSPPATSSSWPTRWTTTGCWRSRPTFFQARLQAQRPAPPPGLTLRPAQANDHCRPCGELIGDFFDRSRAH